MGTALVLLYKREALRALVELKHREILDPFLKVGTFPLMEPLHTLCARFLVANFASYFFFPCFDIKNIFAVILRAVHE
jgi:hypothetical protein